MKKYFTKMFSMAIESIPSKWIYNRFNNIVPIFMLHRLYCEDKNKQNNHLSHIEWCLSYLRKHKYKPISLDQLAYCYINKIPVEPKSVVFTIDDGFVDQYEVAGPLFSKYDIPLTYFVISDFLDGSLWPWDDQISYILQSTTVEFFNIILPGDKKLSFENNRKMLYNNKHMLRNEIKRVDQTNLYTWLDYFYEEAKLDKPITPPDCFKAMSWSNAQELINSGHKIAPHTKTHRILSKLSPEDSRIEIFKSNERVKEMLNNSSNLFAYPTGRSIDYEKKDIRIVHQNKFDLAVTAEHDYFTMNEARYEIPRFSLPNNRFDFIQYLSFFEALKKVVR